MAFGGVEALLVPWLTSTLGVRVVTETPSDLQTAGTVHRVTSLGGGAYPKAPKLISPRLVVTTFAVGYGTAEQAAWDVVRAVLNLLPNTTIAGSTVTGTGLNAGPTWVPYVDTTVRQVSTTFELTIQTA